MLDAAVVGRRLAALLVVFSLASQTARADPPAGADALLAKPPTHGAPDGAQAWRIRYRSFAESGAPVEISGIVIVPAGAVPAGGRDIVSWGHGTVGIAGAPARPAQRRSRPAPS